MTSHFLKKIYRPFFIGIAYKSDPLTSSKTWNHSKKRLFGVGWGVITLKLISNFYIITKTVEILAKTTFSTERLTIELFKSDVPLIVIVARQNGTTTLPQTAPTEMMAIYYIALP